jgi:molybdopterin/thiamine biosynthesis adenylyltransferase
LDDQQLLRYSRNILLDGIDIAGQEKLLASHVLLIGVGGLGSSVATYLASAGVGQLTLCDFDKVDLTNLQRQLIHRDFRIGMNKAKSAKAEILEINRDCKVDIIEKKIGDDDLERLLPSVDLIIDATDNLQSRHMINRASVKYMKPLVSGAAIKFEGQISVYDPRDPLSPCYACFVPEDMSMIADRCATMGVLNSLTGTIGTIQATEALKIIFTGKSNLVGRVLLYDAYLAEWSEIKIARTSNCDVCGNQNNVQ